ncbi:MAG: mechanosensitive ion channel family protein [Thermonemataceae bacterium]|nr:mechanosensitive ion channel family protein [Thermonemataceae bacterium]
MFKWVNQYFDGNILENEPSHIAGFLFLLLIGFVVKGFLAPFLIRLFSKIFIKRADESLLSSFVIYTKKYVSRLLVFAFLYFAFIQLKFPESWNLASSKEFGVKMVLHKAYEILLFILLTNLVLRVISFWGNYFQEKAKTTTNKLDDHLAPFLKEISKVFVILLMFLLTLSNVFELNVTTIVTGLGIGGLAVALAAKETLENLFASFTIFLDKPFITGDLVQVGNILGRVERVGFRTTRIRTLDRSLITLPNKMMIDQALDNWSERSVWRAKFDLSMTYDTPIDILQLIKQEILILLDNHSRTDENNQVFFSEFGDSSLKLTVYYFVRTNDFFEFMSVKDDINFKIHRIVTERGGDFAFPTRTIQIKNKSGDTPKTF